MLDVDQMDELVLLNTLSRPPVLILLTSLREAEEGNSQQEESHAVSHQPRLPDTQIWITIECQLGMTCILWTASYLLIPGG